MADTSEESLGDQVHATQRRVEAANEATQLYWQDSLKTRESVVRFLQDVWKRSSPERQDLVLAFYVAGDKFLPDFLRCVCAPGSKYPAAASHFLRHVDSSVLRHEVPTGEGVAIRFHADAEQDELRESNSPLVLRLLEEDPEHNRVFGDFIVREQVRSRARFVYFENGIIKAVLTVNFRNAVTDDEWQQQESAFRDIFERLISAYPCLPESFERPQQLYLTPWLRIREQMNRLRLRNYQRFRSPTVGSTHPFLASILNEVTDVFANQADHSVFTAVFLRDSREQEMIRCAAHTHRGAEQVQIKADLNVARGEGVVSWVMLRNKAIRIVDIQDARNGAFRKIYVPWSLRSDGRPVEVRSQAAVPIVFDKEIIGVLTIESTKVNSFDEDSIGFLCSVAEEIGFLCAERSLINAVKSSSVDSSESLVDICLKNIHCTFDDAMEGTMREIDSPELRLKALLESSIEKFVPGPRFVELIGDIVGIDRTRDFCQGMKRQAEERPSHVLQLRLDEIVANWVQTGDHASAIERLEREIRPRLRVEMRKINPSKVERVELPIIARSLSAAEFVCRGYDLDHATSGQPVISR